MLDSFVFRIKRVSCQMDAFRQDLCIRSLRSTIGTMVLKVIICSTQEPLSNHLKCNFILLGCYTTVVVRTRSVCQQLTMDRHWHLCVMMMVMTVVLVVMRARSISVVVVVRASWMMVVAVVRCGWHNQKQCQQHCHWHSHGIHGLTSTREAGSQRLP
jgi:hypothetical protein